MRALDWRRVLQENRVPFTERGANVKRGEINIKCPFCGSADPSMHMGLNLESGYWSCWRNKRQHSGKSPVRLLMRLLSVSYARARQIAGLGENAPPDPDGFTAAVARIMGRATVEPEAVRAEFLRMPREFRPIVDRGATRRFYAYLREDRDFDEAGVKLLDDIYMLRADVTGWWKGRVILPYFMDGDLVAWTGRAVAPSAIRYKDLPLEECLVPIKQVLYNYDTMLNGGDTLVIVEGPFDALKLDVYGYEYGLSAVALSTNSMTEEQAFLIEDLAPSFRQVVVMMDNSSVLGLVDSMRLKQDLHGIENLSIMPVPYGRKDAGELTPAEARRFARETTKGARP